MIFTSEKIEVSFEMLINNNMVKDGGVTIGIPVKDGNGNFSLRWKKIQDLKDKDFDSVEEYFIEKEKKGRNEY